MYKVNWQLITDSTDHPQGWVVTGICDNYVCRAPYSSFYYGVIQTSGDIQPGGQCLFEVKLYAPYTSANGTGIIKLKIMSPNQVDTLVFIVHKTPTGIAAIQADDKRVSLYPNPVADDLNVYADKKLGATDISICNIAGSRQITVPFTKGEELTRIPTGALPTGMYMLYISDAAGRAIAVRKFMKQ